MEIGFGVEIVEIIWGRQHIGIPGVQQRHKFLFHKPSKGAREIYFIDRFQNLDHLPESAVRLLAALLDRQILIKR
jgi:hypothetical protein